MRAITSPVAGFTESTKLCAAADDVESACGETAISERIVTDLLDRATDSSRATTHLVRPLRASL